MSWHFSQALVAAYSQATCSDGEQFAPLRSTTMREAYCWRDKTTESLDLFQFGMTLQPSMQNLGGELLTWYLGGFHAPMSASPAPCGGGPGSTENQAACGSNTCESLTNASRNLFSGKTRQNSKAKALTSSFKSFPPVGMYADGQLSALTIAAFHTSGSAFGFSLPTPTSRDWKDTSGMAMTRKDGKTRTDRLPMLLFSLVNSAATKCSQMTATAVQTVSVRGLMVEIRGKDYSPELPEWLMGWPVGWTDYAPLETDKFQEWRRLHGDYLEAADA